MTILAIDIGATYTRVGLFDEEIKLLKQLKTQTYKGDDNLGLASSIIRVVKELVKDSPTKVERVGIASIGPLDVKRGVITKAPNAPFREVPVAGPIAEELDVECYMLNDATAAAYGEYYVTYRGEVENIVYLTISTGIGGGAVINGCLLTGFEGNALEVGHIVVDPFGYVVCGCGSPGHWEAYCSGSGLPKFAEKLVSLGEIGGDTELGMLLAKKELRSERLFELYYKGDEAATSVLKRALLMNAAGIASVANSFDPEVLLVGGSVALKNQQYFEEVFKESRKYMVVSCPNISFASLGELSPLIGAAAVAATGLGKALVKGGKVR